MYHHLALLGHQEHCSTIDQTGPEAQEANQHQISITKRGNQEYPWVNEIITGP